MKRRIVWDGLLVVMLFGSVWLSVPARAEGVATTFTPLDLSHQVNHTLHEAMLGIPGNDLSDLAPREPEPRPVPKTLKGIPFRLDGVVIVGPEAVEAGGKTIPVARKVEGVPVGQKADRLYFLHATHYSAPKGAKIGAYLVHYADGSQEEIPIHYGDDMLDWWVQSDPDLTAAPVAWTGKAQVALGAATDQRLPVNIRLFLKRWENPHPEREIKSLDMVAGEKPSTGPAPLPFLVAVTAGRRG